MGNITDDIRQHFDTFAELPFTEADSLALSQLAYARMPDNVPRYHENAETADGMIATVPIHDLLRAECYDDMFGKVWSPSMNVDLLRARARATLEEPTRGRIRGRIRCCNHQAVLGLRVRTG